MAPSLRAGPASPIGVRPGAGRAGGGVGGRARPLLLASVLFNYSAGPLLRRGRERSARPGAGEGRGARRGEASAERASQVPRARAAQRRPQTGSRSGPSALPPPLPALPLPSPLHSPSFLPLVSLLPLPSSLSASAATLRCLHLSAGISQARAFPLLSPAPLLSSPLLSPPSIPPHPDLLPFPLLPPPSPRPLPPFPGPPSGGSGGSRAAGHSLRRAPASPLRSSSPARFFRRISQLSPPCLAPALPLPLHPALCPLPRALPRVSDGPVRRSDP